MFCSSWRMGLPKVWLTPRPHDSLERVVLKGWHPCRRSLTPTSSSATRSLVASGIPQKQVAKDMAQALRRIRELEMENEVLRRAAAYLSQAHITPPK